jgi:heat shock protein HslJ
MLRNTQVLFVPLLTLAVTLLGTGCTGETAPEANVVDTTEPLVTFEDTDWVLTELNGEAVEVAESMKRPSIRFDSETHLVAGHSAVNQYSGGYTMEGDLPEFGPMRMTMMAGPPEAMELESGFMKALESMTGWRITDGALYFLSGDTTIAVFSLKPQEG